MQAVGPAAVLAHPSSKQEPINFSRFGDVLNKVRSPARNSNWNNETDFFLFVIWCLRKDNLYRNNKTKYFKINLKIFWYFTKTFLCCEIFLLELMLCFTTVLLKPRQMRIEQSRFDIFWDCCSNVCVCHIINSWCFYQFLPSSVSQRQLNCSPL